MEKKDLIGEIKTQNIAGYGKKLIDDILRRFNGHI